MKYLALIAGLLLTLVAHAQDNFPEVSERYRQIHRALAFLKMEGLLIESDLTRDTTYNRELTRAQLAQVVRESIEALPAKLDAWIAARQESPQMDRASDYRYEIEIFTKKAPDGFTLLLKEFSPKDAALKATLESCSPKFKRLAELDRQLVLKAGLTFLFSDVPSDHWAARAIQELRDENILTGYPDGKFRGGN